MNAEKAKRGERTGVIEPKRVYPITLYRFLQERGLRLHEQIADPPNRFFYGPIFRALRTPPAERQEELLVAFYGQYVNNFPNGSELGRFLARINSTPENWFSPYQEPDPEELQRLSDEFYQRLNCKPLPVEIISGDWRVARKIASKVRWQWREAMFDKLLNATTQEQRNLYIQAWQAAEDIMHYASDHIKPAPRKFPIEGKQIVADAVLAAVWTVSEEQMTQRGYQNGVPHQVLFEGVYDKGLWFIGRVDGKSVIFVPEIIQSS